MSDAGPGAVGDGRLGESAAAPTPTGLRRFLAPRWIVGAVLLVVVVIIAARLLRTLPGLQSFIVEYPGAAPLPAGAPVGIPAWVAWQHGLNALFLLFVIRSGWRMHRAERPSTFWTRRNTGPLRTRNPPVRIAIDLWSHYIADTLWVANGVVFLVLTFTSDHWMRIVPTDWGVVPAAVSAGLQYASLDWPTTNGWIDYNALQLLSYFVVVFIAGPVAVLTGLRASPGFAARLRSLDRRIPLGVTKRVHYWTMLFFVAFIVVHVGLVFITGAIRNLNHMYAGRDDQSWAGLLVFAASVIVTVALVFALRPAVVRWSASRTGTVLQRPAPPQRPAR